MHDQVLMRVTHRSTHLQEKLHTLAHRQASSIAIAIDGLAGDEFHHHVGHAADSRAAIQQARDVAMVEAGEDLPLGSEALLGQAGTHVGAHELDGDFGAILIVIAHRVEYITHAAGAQHADDPVRANAFTNAAARGTRGGKRLGAEVGRNPVGKPARLLMRVEQRLHLGEQPRVVAGCEHEKRRPVVGRQLQRSRE